MTPRLQVILVCTLGGICAAWPELGAWVLAILVVAWLVVEMMIALLRSFME